MTYHYDAKEEIFESADRFETRIQEKQPAKHSVLPDPYADKYEAEKDGYLEDDEPV